MVISRVRGGLSVASCLLLNVLIAPSRAIIPPKATNSNLNDFVYDRIQEVCDVGGTLNQPFHSEGGGWPLLPDGDYTWDVYLIDGYCYDEHALVHESDADALAVTLRRTEALLNHLTVLPGAPDMSTLEQEFTALKTQGAGVDPSNTAARKELYNTACAVRQL